MFYKVMHNNIEVQLSRKIEKIAFKHYKMFYLIDVNCNELMGTHTWLWNSWVISYFLMWVKLNSLHFILYKFDFINKK